MNNDWVTSFCSVIGVFLRETPMKRKTLCYRKVVDSFRISVTGSRSAAHTFVQPWEWFVFRPIPQHDACKQEEHLIFCIDTKRDNTFNLAERIIFYFLPSKKSHIMWLQQVQAVAASPSSWASFFHKLMGFGRCPGRAQEFPQTSGRSETSSTEPNPCDPKVLG